MMNYPCTERCPTYAMCKQKTPSVKFDSCVMFSKYVVRTIDETQIQHRKESGKAHLTVIAIKTPDTDTLITADGRSIKYDPTKEDGFVK